MILGKRRQSLSQDSIKNLSFLYFNQGLNFIPDEEFVDVPFETEEELIWIDQDYSVSVGNSKVCYNYFNR